MYVVINVLINVYIANIIDVTYYYIYIGLTPISSCGFLSKIHFINDN